MLELEEVLESVRATAYRWDFSSDTIHWAANARAVLGGIELAKIGKARAFALNIDAEHAGARYDGVTGGPHAESGAALPYTLHYRLLPEGRRGMRRSGSRISAFASPMRTASRSWRKVRSATTAANTTARISPAAKAN